MVKRNSVAMYSNSLAVFHFYFYLSTFSSALAVNHYICFAFTEKAREEVVHFFKRPDNDCTGTGSGWLLLKSLLLLTSDTLVSDIYQKHKTVIQSYIQKSNWNSLGTF